MGTLMGMPRRWRLENPPQGLEDRAVFSPDCRTLAIWASHVWSWLPGVMAHDDWSLTRTAL